MQKNKIIAITGGSGFIGKKLVKKSLELGYQVRLLSRKNSNVDDKNLIKFFTGDLLDDKTNFIDFFNGVDIFYHCAGEVNDESLMHALHIDATKLLIKAAKGRVGRWIQLSSVGAYGHCMDGIIDENSTENPSGTYEETKTQADKLIKNSGIPYVIIRPSNVFGITMRNQSLFQLLKIEYFQLFSKNKK